MPHGEQDVEPRAETIAPVLAAFSLPPRPGRQGRCPVDNLPLLGRIDLQSKSESARKARRAESREKGLSRG